MKNKELMLQNCEFFVRFVFVLCKQYVNPFRVYEKEVEKKLIIGYNKSIENNVEKTMQGVLIRKNKRTSLKTFFSGIGKKIVSLSALSILLCLAFSFFCGEVFAADSGLFSELTEKGGEIFMGMRDIVYVVAGFGIIGVAVGGFFGSINWKWLSAIIIGLVIIAATAAFVQYVTGEKVANITDTLK